ncbi:MAG: hypothetical protein E6J26_08095 [Chloroflexi bacterium]|nr:MAG: hypothetical protein E6J26_08095 [Chloroflexota bacterium]
MAQSSLDRLQRVRDVRVRWLSYELRPERPLTPDEEKAMRAYRMKVDQNWPHVQAMAASYGLAFGARNRNTRSRLALEGAKFAEAHGRADEYAHAIGRDISDPDTLTELARQAGLDGDAFRQALATRAYKAQVDRELALAFTYKLSGVPAFIIGGKYLVVGAQPLENLMDVVDNVSKGGE